MTETPPQNLPSPPRRRLLRPADDRAIAGVCTGLGRHFGIDPVLVRVIAVALLLVSGMSLLVYLLLWLSVPEDDGTGRPAGPAPLARLFTGRDGRVSGGRVALAVVAVLGALVVLPLLVLAAGWVAAEAGAAPVLVAGGVLAVAAVAGALAWRARALLALAPALALLVPAALVAATDTRFEGGYGDRSHRPASTEALPADGYRLSAGAMRIDLRELRLRRGTTTRLPVRVGMGTATVVVPREVCVQATGRVGAGHVDVLGRDAGGWDVKVEPQGSRTPAPRLALAADVGMGALEVVHDPADARLGPDGQRWENADWHGDRDGGDPRGGGQAIGNRACESVERRDPGSRRRSSP